MRNNTVKNIVANVASKIWSLVSIYLFVPIYIKYLGEEAYGLVSFFATMQTALNLLGMGLSSTLRREFAMSLEGGHCVNLRKYKLLRSIELLFSFIAILIIFICCVGARTLATKWLNSSDLDIPVVITTIRLMGISIALQLVAQLYFGAMLGMAKQVRANLLNIIYAMAKAAGAVVIIIWIKSDIRWFYAWHVLVDLVYIVVLRIMLIKSISGSGKLTWTIKDVQIVEEIWQYTLGLVVISLIAFANKQMDRIIISKFMTLTQLGAYNSCYTLGQVITIVSSAAATAVFSEFANVYSDKKKKKNELQTMYLKFYKWVTLVVLALGCFIAVYSESLLIFWTKSSAYAEIMSGGSAILILGSMSLALQEIPYAFVLAQGNTTINRKMGIACLLPFGISMYYAVKYNGIIGASSVYFIIMIIQTLIYIGIIYRKYCYRNTIKWILRETIAPASCAFALALISHTASKMLALKGLNEIVFAIGTGAFSLIVLFILFDKTLLIKSICGWRKK